MVPMLSLCKHLDGKHRVFWYFLKVASGAASEIDALKEKQF